MLPLIDHFYHIVQNISIAQTDGGIISNLRWTLNWRALFPHACFLRATLTRQRPVVDNMAPLITPIEGADKDRRSPSDSLNQLHWLSCIKVSTHFLHNKLTRIGFSYFGQPVFLVMSPADLPDPNYRHALRLWDAAPDEESDYFPD